MPSQLQLARLVAAIAEFGAYGQFQVVSTKATIQTSLSWRIAVALVVPGAVIFAASFFLIPWMIETERRLQNDYWEGQLVFAIFALTVASAGFPFLVLRLFCSRRTVAIVCWTIAILGYLAVLVYIAQSHFPIIERLVIGLLFVAFIAASMKALKEDLARNRLA